MVIISKFWVIQSFWIGSSNWFACKELGKCPNHYQFDHWPSPFSLNQMWLPTLSEVQTAKLLFEVEKLLQILFIVRGRWHTRCMIHQLWFVKCRMNRNELPNCSIEQSQTNSLPTDSLSFAFFPPELELQRLYNGEVLLECPAKLRRTDRAGTKPQRLP